jgi:hypothetical protein
MAADKKEDQPRRMTTGLKKKIFLAAYDKSLGNVSGSCLQVGIHRQTFYDWMNKDPAFKNKVEETNEKQIDFVESQLLKNIQSADTTSIIFFLKTKGKARGYKEKFEMDVDLKSDGKPILPFIIKKAEQ